MLIERIRRPPASVQKLAAHARNAWCLAGARFEQGQVQPWRQVVAVGAIKTAVGMVRWAPRAPASCRRQLR